MNNFDRYDFMTGTELKYESKKRGIPIQQNKAAFKFRILLRLDDAGKIPSYYKFLKPGTKKIPDFWDLLRQINPPVRNNFSPIEQDALSESQQSVPSV